MKINILTAFLVLSQVVLSQNKVLVYHETNGFRHSSIDDGIDMITNLGEENGLWTTDNSDDSSVFTISNLQNYNVVIWCNTSGDDLLTNEEQSAFEAYIANGGGYVGIHAATDTYRDRSWPFYNDLAGAIVQTGPNHTSRTHNNTMDIVEAHEDHQSVSFLNGESWNKTEEYYYWRNNGGQLYEGNNNLLIVRETGSNNYDEARPISWYKEYMGGRSFYTALGHNDSDYTDDINFITHVEEGIKWAGDLGVSIPFEQVIDNGDYYIQDVDLNLALETDLDNGAYTSLLEANNEGQIWSFVHQANDVYSLQNKLTDWYLETPRGDCEDGANVATWRESNSTHHTFKVIKSGDDYILEPGHCGGKALSATRSENEENASLKNVNTSDASQLWKLVTPENVVLSSSEFELAAGKQIKTYPNPVIDVLTISGLIPELAQDLQIEIYDIVGNKIIEQQVLSEVADTIDLSQLSVGIYFVKYSNTAIPPQRIVKQ